MRRFIIGFVTGVTATGAVVLMPWGEPGGPVEIESVLQAPTPAVERHTDTERLSDESAQSGRRQGVAAPADSPQALAIERPEQDEARYTIPPAEPREAYSPRLERRALEAEEAMQAEAVDVEWAQRVQAEFWNYLSQKPDLHQFGSLQVDCRSTWCEVKFVSYGESVPDFTALHRLLFEGANEVYWSERWSVIGAKTGQEHGRATASVFVQNFGSSSHQFSLWAGGDNVSPRR